MAGAASIPAAVSIIARSADRPASAPPPVKVARAVHLGHPAPHPPQRPPLPPLPAPARRARPPVGVQPVDPHDPQPVAEPVLGQHPHQQRPRRAFSSGGTASSRSKMIASQPSSRTLTSARSFEAGIYSTDRQGRDAGRDAGGSCGESLQQHYCVKEHPSAAFRKRIFLQRKQLSRIQGIAAR